MSYYPENFKRKLILDYLLPELGINVSADPQKAEDIISRCSLKDMIKYQQIESPGLAQEGSMFFFRFGYGP